MHSNVRDFHIAFDLFVSDVPGLPDATIRSLRRSLLAEEVQELLDAENDNDIVEIADALADIIYIAAGTAVSYGFELLDKPYGAVSERPALPHAEIRADHQAHIQNLYTAYVSAEEANDLNLIRETLQYLMDSASACAATYNIPLQAVFSEVHASNLAKLVDGKVLRRPDGKVQKPISWVPPNIKAILFP